MFITVTDPSFIHAASGLAFDVEVDMSMHENGFNVAYRRRLKDSNGDYIADFPTILDTDFVPQTAAQTLFNNIKTGLTNLTKSKF
jgi:hypothetical protein